MPSRLSEALLGSALEAGFGLDSDLDLCVEGLSSAALLEAMALLAEAELASVPPEQRLPVDLHQAWDASEGFKERCDAAALRLQSF